MATTLSTLFGQFGVRARLLSAFTVMVILTVSVGGVGWFGVKSIQQALDMLQEKSLPEIAQSMSLAEQSASLVAQAPIAANAKILFHLNEESARLEEKLKAFSNLVHELHDIERNGVPNAEVNPGAPAKPLLGSLALKIEATLLELVDVTRNSIFLTARMRDRQYELSTVYGAIESKIDSQIDRSEERRREKETGNTTEPPIGESDQALALSESLGETHRMTGALTAARTAEDAENLVMLENRYSRGSQLLTNKLEQLNSGNLSTGLAAVINQLLRLGEGENNIFELRRAQFTNEDRRTYLLTVSNILSAELNRQVATIVDGVKKAAEARGNDAVTVLNNSKLRILFLGAACLIAAIVSAFYVVRDLGGNLSAVTRSMIQLAKGERETEVPATERPDEIGSLARAFSVFKENMFKLDETSRQLAENNKLLETIFRNMNDGLSVFDAQGRLIAWNPRFMELYGLSGGDVGIGTPIEAIDDILSKNRVTAQSLDGRFIQPGSIKRRRQLTDQQFEEHLPDGRTLELRSRPMPEGGFITIYTDLTARKKVEEQLRQAQKMESVGQLTGGLAHDFNNLLTAIMGNLSLLQEELAGQERLRKKALRALEAADRGAMITQRLLAFSRKQALQYQQVNVNELIEGMIDLLIYSVGEPITIRVQLQENLWPIVIDPGQLENALMNLVLNSRDAMPEGGQLLIQTKNYTLDEAAAQQDFGIEAGNYVLLEIKDTGAGMSPEVLNRVFEPFFTTKEVGAGSGLGLSMVYGFIKQSGGHIIIDSALGGGTTIQLYLPQTDTDTSARPSQPRGPKSWEPDALGINVMVVEDEENVRQVAVDMLKSFGCRTVEASNGTEALALLDEISDITLLFTDVVLPGGMNGPEVVQEARKKYPDLKVLFCSGHTRNALIKDGYLKPDVDLIEKPYKKEALAQKLRAVLGR